MNDEEAQKMIDVVEEAYTLGLFNGKYEDYASLRARIIYLQNDLERLERDISRLKASIERRKEAKK